MLQTHAPLWEQSSDEYLPTYMQLEEGDAEHLPRDMYRLPQAKIQKPTPQGVQEQQIRSNFQIKAQNWWTQTESCNVQCS